MGDRREKGKLQIAPLKFSGDWILHPEISEFGFYPLKFVMFRFYILKFQNLDFTPYILEVFGFYSLKFWGV